MRTLIVFGVGFALLFVFAFVVNYRRQRRTSQTHLPPSVAGLDHPAHRPPADKSMTMIHYGSGGS